MQWLGTRSSDEQALTWLRERWLNDDAGLEEIEVGGNSTTMPP